MSDNDGEFGAFLAGFVVGGLVGAAVALLLAPYSGQETRKLIQDKSIELKNTTLEQAEQARARAEAAAAEARKHADELAKLAKERAEEVRKRGSEIFAEQKTKVEKAIEAGKGVVQRKTKAASEPPAEPPAEAPAA